MRTWRVGTVSMGLALILLGVFLILSQIFSWQPAYVMLSWWPVILIVLGLEVLIYLFLSKQKNPTIKYDFFSIIFIGFIGFASIGFVAMSATGIVDKVYEWTNFEVKTVDLPTYSEQLDDSVKRIVVRIGSEPLEIETGETNEMVVFGTYTGAIEKDKVPIEVSEDYLLTEQQGDTLFVHFKNPPTTSNPSHNYIDQDTTMMIPNHVEVEIDANHQALHVNSRTLQNDWLIMNASDVNVVVASDLDVIMNAKNIGHIHNEDHNWELLTSNEEDEEFAESESGTLQLGKGTYIMNILNTSGVAVIKR